MKYIFIGGSQRSGTTLVQTLFSNALGNKLVLPETHLICDLLYFYQHGLSEWKKTEFFFKTHEKFRDYTVNSINQIIFQNYDLNEKQTHIVLKDPNFTLYLDEIYDLFPDSIFLLCARDPRDIVCSFYDIERREKNNKKLNARYKNRNITFYCSKIINSYKKFLKYNSSPRIVYYEEIVSDTQSYLKNIFDDLKLPYSQFSCDNLNWTDKNMRHKESWISPLEGKKPSSKRVGIYQNKLYDYEINYIQKRCSLIMQYFNYKMVDYEKYYSWYLSKKMALIRKLYYS